MKSAILSLSSVVLVSAAFAQSGSELRFCLRNEPKTFNPLLVEDDASETVRYLTGGVLIRVNLVERCHEPSGLGVDIAVDTAVVR